MEGITRVLFIVPSILKKEKFFKIQKK
jgi:hypothetical protein